jgi:predicted nucleic acid-binding protein
MVWLEPELCQTAYQVLPAVHLRNAIDPVDLLIAQVAISLDLPLYTFNQKHFDVVPGLKTIRPYTR